MMTKPVIAVLTDFGTEDPFVGIMKGVIATIAPEASIIDLSQDMPPGDILRAGIALWQAKNFFPASTVFLCVVDPGVGTSRRGIIAQSGGQYFVGPDNGLFTFILNEQSQIWELSNPDLALPDPGTTFHGRDIFAPAAAYAALGTPGPSFGPSVPDPIKLPKPVLELQPDGSITGEILYADHFGNLLTSIGRFQRSGRARAELVPWLPDGIRPHGSSIASEWSLDEMKILLPDGKSLPWASTFAELSGNECAFLLGSSGLLEIVANRKNASEMLDLHPGQSIILRK